MIRARHLPLHKPGQSLTAVAQRYSQLWLVAVPNQNNGHFPVCIGSHLVEIDALDRSFLWSFKTIPGVLTVRGAIVRGLNGVRRSVNAAALCQQRKAKVEVVQNHQGRIANALVLDHIMH